MKLEGSKINNMWLTKVLLGALLLVAPVQAFSQEIVDKTVATVSDAVRTELITYSDLKWQLALQPGAPLETPSKDDLDQALRLVID